VDGNAEVFGAEQTWALFDGDVDAVRELIALVVADLPAYLRKLRASVESGDHATAARDAHRIKGTVLNVGASRLAALCEATEQAARQSAPTLMGLVAEMTRETEVLIAALTAWDQTLAVTAARASSDRV
jgi:HPt (histidine-containing phosphotransfer) domain-containing protein